MNQCKWIYQRSGLITVLRPSCCKAVGWYEEFFDTVKVKYCPYCGKEVVKTELVEYKIGGQIWKN